MLQNWICQTDIITSSFIPPVNKYGFIYVIVRNDTGKSYIGQKKFMQGWQNYYGSCKPLNEDIKLLGKDQFTRIIIKYADNEEELSELETKFQIAHDVVTATFDDGTPKWYNGVISYKGYKFYRAQKGRIVSDEERQRTSNRFKGKEPANKGKPGSPNIALANKKRKGQPAYNKGIPAPPSIAAANSLRKGIPWTPEQIKQKNDKLALLSPEEIASRKQKWRDSNAKTNLQKKLQKELLLTYCLALKIHFKEI